MLVGVFVTWVADGPVRLDGTQGPNNGWLAAIVAGLALFWIPMLRSWPGVIGVLGAGLVIGWTALENWLDARADDRRVRRVSDWFSCLWGASS